MGKTLVFAVFDFDRFTKNDEIGEVSKNNSAHKHNIHLKSTGPGACLQYRLGLFWGAVARNKINIRRRTREFISRDDWSKDNQDIICDSHAWLN